MKVWLGALLLVVVTATVCFSISATTGSASRSSRVYDLYPGELASFVGVDWDCGYYNRNGGRVIGCGRSSTFAGVGVETTGGWVRVWRYPASRRGSKTLLYEHRRNP
jgi:hypothetical protein